MGYVLGIISGILVSVLFLLVCGKVLYKKQYKDKVGYFQEKKIYDERQLMARGRAYKGGYFTLMGSLLILLIANESVKDINFMNYSGVFGCIILSVAVFAIICILKDAYMSLYESAKKVIVMFVVLGALNLAIGISEFRTVGGFIATTETGVIRRELSDCVSSLMAGAALLMICIVFLVKVSHDKKTADEDELEEE